MADQAWRAVVGFDGFYQVSDMGLVQSVNRTVPGPSGPKTVRERILKPTLVRGYPSVTLYRDGLHRQVGVHILVAAAFIGPCPEGQEVCHNDGHAGDAKLTNLRYDTPKNNHADKLKHGTLLRGEGVGNSKLKAIQVSAIKEAFVRGALQCDLAKTYGVSRALICKIVRNSLWKHVPAGTSYAAH